MWVFGWVVGELLGGGVGGGGGGGGVVVIGNILEGKGREGKG